MGLDWELNLDNFSILTTSFELCPNSEFSTQAFGFYTILKVKPKISQAEFIIQPFLIEISNN